MSLQSHGDPQLATCPYCGTESMQAVSRNINANRWPFYRQAIMSGTLHRITCGECGEEFFIDTPLHYCDFERNEWIMMYPLAWEPQWRRWANDVNVTYNEAYAGPETPSFVRDNPPRLWRRAVFGLPALREKLVLHEAGIDDITLEAFKLTIMLQAEGSYPGPDFRPRCVGTNDSTLLFSHWVRKGDELVAAPATIARADVLSGMEALKSTALVAELQATPYIDIGSIMYLEDAAAAA